MTRFLALLMLAALPAGAYVPEPPCGVNTADGRLLPFSDPYSTVGVWPVRYPGDVVSVEWGDAEGTFFGYIQICQTDATLRWSLANADNSAIWTRLAEMLEGEAVHTLGDVGRMIRSLGGQAALVDSPGTCACEVWRH